MGRVRMNAVAQHVRSPIGNGSNPFNFACEGQTDEEESEDTGNEGSLNLSEARALRIDEIYIIDLFTNGRSLDKITNLGMRFGKGNPNREIRFRERKERIKYRSTYVNSCAYNKCTRTFVSLSSNKRYCSIQCKNKNISIEKKKEYRSNTLLNHKFKCVLCGLLFNDYKIKRKYCSKACTISAIRCIKTDKNNLTKCTYHKCNKLFNKNKTVIGSDGLVYCSPACCRHW